MKKNNLDISKLITLLLAVLFINCEKTEESGFIEERNPNARLSHINFDQFKDKLGNKETLDQLSNNFDFNYKRDNFNSEKTDKWDRSSIITNDILFVKDKEVNTFTFKLDNNETNGRFYNLVLDVNKNGIVINSRILRYTPTLKYINDPSQTFSGWVQVEKDNAFDLTGDSLTNSGGLCVTNITYEWSCNAGNGHASDTCYAGGSDLIVTLTYGPCADDNEDPIIDTGGDGGSGTGLSGGPGTGTGNPSGGGNGGTSPMGGDPCNGGTGLSGGGNCFDPIDAELYTLIQDGTIISFKDANVPSNAPNYNSIAELQDAINNFEEINNGVTPYTIDQQKLHKTRLVSKHGVANLNIEIDSKLQNLHGTGTYEFKGATSYLSGVTAFQEWKQQGEPQATKIDQERHFAEITISATYTWKLGYKGVGLELTSKKIIKIVLETRSGQMLGYNVFSSF